MSNVSLLFQGVSVREYQWTPALPRDLELGFNEIHVWSRLLTRTSDEVASFQRLLSPDEVQRATRFRFDDSRADYVISRGTLRSLLGLYLNAAGEDLRFD